METSVLVIEDNSTNLALMTYLLEHFGYKTLKATDGEDGLAVARQDRPDIILCDLHMPGVSGWEFAERIKKDPAMASIPLVAVTAFAMVGDRERVMAAGFDGYIAKPIEPETFVASVAAFLPVGTPAAMRPRTEQDAALRGISPVRGGPAGVKAPVDAPRTNGLKVLVVDDLPSNVGLVRYIIEGAGYCVTDATGVTAGLKAARDTVPDVIITDTHMSPLDGFDLLAAIRADPRLRSVPVILTSASGNYGETRTKAIASGAINFLPHPIMPDTLLAAVAGCLRIGVRE
jgi:two-component system cell cycle response regulator